MERGARIKAMLNSKKHLFILGTVVTLAMLLPFWILGEDSVITYHDQLDGEVLTYILNAKYLFTGAENYPELMNGIPSGGMVSPAPAFVLLFKLLPPFGAFMTMLTVVKLVAFGSMFLLLCELTERKWAAFLCAICFMALPFYAVYGLCIPGQPLLFFAIRRLQKEEGWGSLKWYGAIVLYGLCSSLALVGFACLLLMGVWGLAKLLQKKYRSFFKMVWAAGVLGVTYLLTNLELVKQLFGGTDYVSHKSEIVFQAVSFWEAAKALILTGDAYTEAQQKYMLPLIGLAFLVLLVQLIKKKRVGNRYYLYALCTNAVMIVLTAFYRADFMVECRNVWTGVLHDFNLGRIAWLLTVQWYLLLVTSIDILLDAVKEIKGAKLWSAVAGGGCVLTLGAVFLTAVYISDVKPNVMKILKGGDYYMMTWEQFYAEDLFDEVEELIGKPKEEYRVVSLGIYPAAAAYNGFYCLDAYSNNYDVEYKHQFRKIMEKELEKSDYLAGWFDGWGNRCYLVLAESNTYFTFEKRWIPVSNEVDFDYEQLRNMGCEYMVSASYIMEAESMGLTLLNPEPIQTEGSWYRLWVYTF